MLLNIDDFLLYESLALARKVLTDKDINPDQNEDFKIISTKLKKFPAYLLKFTEFRFNDNVSMDRIIEVIDWLLKYPDQAKKFKTKIVDCKDIEEIDDQIKHVEQDSKINKFYKSIYAFYREKIEALPEEEKKKWDDLALAFMELSPEVIKTFTPMWIFKNNNVTLDEFKNAVEEFTEKQVVNSKKSNILEKIKTFGQKVQIVYDDHDVLVIRTEDKQAVKELGSDKWCIVYAQESYWEGYIGKMKFTTQYIVFNFNLPASSSSSIFGITIDLDGKTTNGQCQNKANTYIPLSDVLEMTGIPEGVIISRKKEDKEKFENEKQICKNLFEDIKNKKIDLEDGLEQISKLEYADNIFNKNDLKVILGENYIKEFLVEKLNKKDSIYDIYEKYKILITLLSSDNANVIGELITDEKRLIDWYCIYMFTFKRSDSNSSDSKINPIFLIKIYTHDIKKLLKYNDYTKEVISNLIKKFADPEKNYEGFVEKTSIDKFIEWAIADMLENLDYYDTFDRFLETYKKFHEDDYEYIFDEHFNDIYEKFYQEEEFLNFVKIEGVKNNDFIKDILPDFTEFSSENNYSIYGNVDNVKNIASFYDEYFKLNPDDLNNDFKPFKKNSFILHCLWSTYKTPEYEKLYYKRIGNIDELNRLYISYDEFSDLNEYFKMDDVFSDDPDRFYYNEDLSNSGKIDMIGKLDISNIVIFAKILKNGGFDLNQEIISKYDTKEYSTLNYKQSIQTLRNNDDIRSLYSEIQDIFSDYDYYEKYSQDLYSNIDIDQIFEYIEQSYNDGMRSGTEDEFFNKALNQLTDIFNKWDDDSDGVYKGKLYKWLSSKDKNDKTINKLVFNVDIKSVLDKVSLIDLGYSYEGDCTIDKIISEYIDENGKFDFDTSYLGEMDYDVFNESLGSNVWDLIPKEEQNKTVESLEILNFYDFIKS